MSVANFDVRDHVSVMSNSNVKMSNMASKGTTGVHGVFSKVNGNEQLVESCGVKGLVTGNIWLEKRDKHKYTYSSGKDGQWGSSDYILIDGCVREKLLDVNVLKEAAVGMSDHYLAVVG